MRGIAPGSPEPSNFSKSKSSRLASLDFSTSIKMSKRIVSRGMRDIAGFAAYLKEKIQFSTWVAGIQIAYSSAAIYGAKLNFF